MNLELLLHCRFRRRLSAERMEKPMTGEVYMVVENGMEYTDVKRVYLDEGEANAFVAAYNAVTPGMHLEVEPHPLGAPAVEYDGPVFTAHWRTYRKREGETQLIITREDGFTMVVPRAVPGPHRYVEMFALTTLPEYEEPPVWIDQFNSGQQWHSGDHPGEAAVITRDDDEVAVRGTGKDAVEALVREIASQVKAERGQ